MPTPLQQQLYKLDDCVTRRLHLLVTKVVFLMLLAQAFQPGYIFVLLLLHPLD